MEHPRSIVVDVSALTEPDERTLEHLARLQLAAHRLGASIRLHNAPPALVDLLDLAGLSDVLPVVDGATLLEEASSGVEVERLVEEREQLGVDEEIDPGDPAL